MSQALMKPSVPKTHPKEVSGVFSRPKLTRRRIFQRLIEPASHVTDPIDRRNARILMVFFIIVTPIALINASLAPLLMPGESVLLDFDFLVALAATIFWILAYWLSRQGRYKIAALFAIAIAGVFIFTTTIFDNDLRDIYYLAVVILFSSMVLSQRMTALVSGVFIGLILLLPLIMPEVQFRDVIVAQASFMIIASSGILVATQHREKLERARREDLTKFAANLERRTQELQQFSYIASHDLQEPLRMVTSYLQLLGRRYKDDLDEDADEFIQYALDGALRMQNLTQDLLAYTSVEVNDSPWSQVDFNKAVWKALSNLESPIRESNAEVSWDPLPTLAADPDQMVHLFQQLVANAIKFRNNAPPEVQIQANLEGQDWVFSVQDNGIGIEPKYHDRVFEIFKKLHHNAVYPGTGVGLAICKRIVERHEGQIWVESDPGRGATIYFKLPDREAG